MSQHIHLMGMSGIGVSALAQVLSAHGVKVSGCDLKKTTLSHRLEQQGIQFFEGHDPSHLQGVDMLVYSSAISNSPEIQIAKTSGVLVYPRGKLLAQLVNQQFGIAVCGAHGKTTTTSLISTILKETGVDPTFLIGGEVKNLGGNAGIGRGNIWVTEADESDGSFLELMPKIGVITNMDREHMDFYKNETKLKLAYQTFMHQVSRGGVLIACLEDLWIRKLLEESSYHFISYGMSPSAQIQARNISLFPLASEFDLFFNDHFLTHAKVNVPGEHNVLNSLASFVVGMEVGISPKRIAEAILSFYGAERRFQIKNQTGDIWVIDDYAHHPTEIKATLKAVRGLGRGRVVVIFEPHRYTRTLALLKEFSHVLQQADYLILTEIYPASESPIPGVNGRQLYEKVIEYGHRFCEFIEKDVMVDYLLKMIQEGDTILFMGAGDITKIADEVAEKIKVGSFVKI